MALPESLPRNALHTRRVECRGYRRADGLWRGLTIGRGWRREVLARLGGVRGCTHLVEVLWPMATAAYQTIYPVLARERAAVAHTRPPSHLDSCHALARDGEVVREHHPRWYTGGSN